MTAPLAPGSVSLNLYAHDAVPRTALRLLREEALSAERAGFDGITVSEHHGGFPGYLPNPLQAAGWLLHDLDRAWAGPLPLLLPLRTAALVAEELAWLAVRFPERVAAGFAPGYRQEELDLAGVDPRDLARVYGDGLATVAMALAGAGDGLLHSDPALTATAGSVPLVSAIGSHTAARRAAAAGTGLLLGGSTAQERLQGFVAAFREAGGRGPVILIRRVWLGGDAPREALERLYAGYGAAARGAAGWIDSGDHGFVTGQADDVARRLAQDAGAAGATALSLRVHLPGLPADATARQINRVGQAVLPPLRAMWTGKVAVGDVR